MNFEYCYFRGQTSHAGWVHAGWVRIHKICFYFRKDKKLFFSERSRLGGKKFLQIFGYVIGFSLDK
jgi:hypothetical protein